MAFHATESFPFGDIAMSSISSPSLGTALVVQQIAFEPTLPEGMAVDLVAAYRIEFVVDYPIQQFVFDIAMIGCRTNGDPNSGECLDAQSWSIDNGLVMIGTEDGESLHARMPWLSIGDDDYPIRYLDHGFRIEIPYVAPNTPVGFHFVLAYNRVDARNDSEWFAVDVQHSKLRRLSVVKHIAGAITG